MNQHIQDIMRVLKVSIVTANEVYDNMQIDLSECSQREFNSHARAVYEALRMVELEGVA